MPLFPDVVGLKNFSGGSVAPNAKCYQLSELVFLCVNMYQ